MIQQLGKSIGVGFQIVDDFLDEFGNQDEIGKPVGSDLKNEKINILSIYDEGECKKIINEKHAKSIAIAKKLFDIDCDKDIFKIIDYIYQRKM